MSTQYWICEDCLSDYVAVKDGKLRCIDCGGENLASCRVYDIMTFDEEELERREAWAIHRLRKGVLERRRAGNEDRL